MKFGDPIIYYCASCKKPMKMMTYMSYTVHNRTLFSDGDKSYSTPEFAKCPNCDALFFRHNIKKKKKVKSGSANDIDRIKEPRLEDLIRALNEKTAKTWQEEIFVREDLWRELNNGLRHGRIDLSDDEYKLWKENCAALLPLNEKEFAEMELKKKKNDYNKRDKDNLLITIAELNRNNEKFDKCIEVFEKLDSDWDWLKKQFKTECEKKNHLPFKLMSKREMSLKDNENVKGDADGG